jgi:predicted  nucleic acid-binding Zn-ribbon protein
MRGDERVQPRSFEQRITSLEEQMLERRDLPNRVAKLESQVLQLRKELRDEFSAIRWEMKAADDETRVFMRILYEDVLSRLEVIGEGDGTDRSDQ